MYLYYYVVHWLLPAMMLNINLTYKGMEKLEEEGGFELRIARASKSYTGTL